MLQTKKGLKKINHVYFLLKLEKRNIQNVQMKKIQMDFFGVQQKWTKMEIMWEQQISGAIVMRAVPLEIPTSATHHQIPNPEQVK